LHTGTNELKSIAPSAAASLLALGPLSALGDPESAAVAGDDDEHALAIKTPPSTLTAIATVSANRFRTIPSIEY
jgi:hypothetical protein